ncbi:hypothetical protein niasHT_015624 [Heterodera trifolii]|uniref:Uncharacterized protein n=1 Tax=Heterodera trifolii TaxID=157864 RepID=A0ABD2L4K6_9BILA
MKERDGPTSFAIALGMITQFRSLAFLSARPTFIRSKTDDQRNDGMANWPFNKNAWAKFATLAEQRQLFTWPTERMSSERRASEGPPSADHCSIGRLITSPPPPIASYFIFLFPCLSLFGIAIYFGNIYQLASMANEI